MNGAIADRLQGFRPKVGVVLGSGLGAFVEEVTATATIPYGELPGFPETHVNGHDGQLVLGHVGPTPVAVLKGRAHYYEQGRPDVMKDAVRALAAMGCETLVLTAAAGSLRLDMPPGSPMVISDHINFTGVNPLFGEPGDSRFVDMVDAYDPKLVEQMQSLAHGANIICHDGVYVFFSGPSFETAAEIRAARTLGADAVGMSIVPETIVARQAGMKVVGLALMTNFAAGMTREKASHEQTLAVAGEISAKVRRLLRLFLEHYR